eukprot:7056127-Pyramimonas_sp.AAC.1
MSLVGADCYARVGQATEDDDHITIGHHGLADVNARGQWLKQWAAHSRLRLANEFFRKQPGQLCAYTSPQGVQRQIDFVLTNRRVWSTMCD